MPSVRRLAPYLPETITPYRQHRFYGQIVRVAARQSTSSLHISRPDGVDRSKLSCKLTKATPSGSRSAIAVTRCFSECPNRSSFQTTTASKRPCADHEPIERRSQLARAGDALVSVFLSGG